MRSRAAEPDIDGKVHGVATDPVRASQVIIAVAKGAATQYLTTSLKTDRVFLWQGLVRILSIPAPFVDVSAHVVQAKMIGFLRPNGLRMIIGGWAVEGEPRHFASGFDVGTVCRSATGKITGGEVPFIAEACRIFPFRLGRQSEALGATIEYSRLEVTGI